MPWKNGAGETREIIVSPPGATLATLDWRVSLATVTEDGPFSMFVGIQRTLCVVRGGGLRLEIEDKDAITLSQESPPFTFDGQVPARAFLVAGAIVDLNVMSRRAGFRHTVNRVVFSSTLELKANGHAMIVFCHHGDLSCVDGKGSVYLQSEDCVVLDRETEHVRLVATRPTEIVVITIDSLNKVNG